MKPGWQTSEFWLTVATDAGIVAAALTGELSPKYAAIAVAVSKVAYAIARGLAKVGNGGV